MKRDVKLSNMKGLLIFLVVFGHLIAPYRQSYNGFYLGIYSFHMPLFILISGYFAKHASYKKVINMILLYLTFQPIYKVFLMIIKPELDFNIMYDRPYYHLWYLVSMAAWCLIAIVIQKSFIKNISKVFLVFSCFIIGIISRFFTGPVVSWVQNYDSDYNSYTLSYQRTLSFLPFFLLGMMISQDTMHRLYHSLKGRIRLLLIIITGVFVLFLLAHTNNLEYIIKGSYGVDQMKGNLLATTAKIVLGYILALLICYILLNLISNKQTILTKWGDRTLPIFLFHMFAVRFLKDSTFLKSLNQWLQLPLLFIITIVIVCLLSSDLFIHCTYYVWHPFEAVKNVKKKLGHIFQPKIS